MTIGLNKIFLAGNLGSDPQSFEIKGGESKMAKFSLAVNERRGDGEEATNWFRVSVFGKQAEACIKYLSKGSPVLVEGTVRVSKYKDKEGNEREGFDVTVGYNGNVQFLPGGGSKTSGTAGGAGNDEVPF